MALFAYVGFEACCAIAEKIEDGQRNAAKVIMISFGLVIVIYTIFQVLLLGLHGGQTTNPFLEILPKLTSNATLIGVGNYLVSFAILASFLAGFYGMFYYNNWNLYSIGRENSILFAKQLTKLNNNNAPWVSVIFGGVVVALFLLITTNSEYLVNMADFATTLTYFLSALSFVVLISKPLLRRFDKLPSTRLSMSEAILRQAQDERGCVDESASSLRSCGAMADRRGACAPKPWRRSKPVEPFQRIHQLYGYLAIASSLVLVSIFVYNLTNAGIQYILPFFIILGMGLAAHKINGWKNAI